MLVEVSPNARAGCRVCGAKVSWGQLRVGLPYDTDWGSSVKWHHVGCVQLSKFVPSASALVGFDKLDAGKRAELEQQFGAALPPAPAPAPSSSHPGCAAPSGSRSAPVNLESPDALTPRAGKAPPPGGGAAASRPEQLAEEPPFEVGICKIEYAKAKKPSNCKACSGPIRNGEPRVGDSQPSPFYEGLQTRWLCLRCAVRGHAIQRYSQLDGWDRMGYDCSREVRAKTGELLSDAAELALREAMEPIEALTDALTANLAVDELKATLALNGIDSRATGLERDSISMAHVVADGLLNGLCADCPCCGMAALHFASGRIACVGSIGGLARCPYRARPADVPRFRFELPDAMRDADWLLEWVGIAQLAAATPPPAKGKGTKRKAAARPPIVGSRALAGLALVARKAAATVTKGPLPPPPARQPPEPGCPLLEVHRGFKQTGLFHRAKVLVDDDGVTVYSAHLNEVQVEKGVNRYYIVQALLVNGKPEVFCHWGATGREDEEEFGGARARDNCKRYPCKTKAEAIETFKHWFTKKTNFGRFDERHAFKQTPGWYNFVELSSRARADSRANTPSRRTGSATGAHVAACTLEPAVASLVSLVFDEDAILTSMEGSGVDCDAGGFGIHSLTPERLAKARAVLAELAQLLATKPPDALPDAPPAAPAVAAPAAPPPSRPGRAKRPTAKARAAAAAASAVAAAAATAVAAPPRAADDARHQFMQAQLVWRARVEAASNDFQQTVPAREPVRIDNAEKLADKARTLDVLDDIALGQRLLADGKQGAAEAAAAASSSAAAGSSSAAEPGAAEPHPLDVQFATLKCTMRVLPHDDATYRAIAAAVVNTCEPLKYDGLCGFTHRTQDEVELLDVFELAREGEAAAHESRFAELGNRRLLWHGTAVGCAAAIVAQGLRIMEGAGGRVGRGIYSADEMNKSGHYTVPTKRGEAIMFLAEAALGRAHVITADNASLQRPPTGFDSVIAEGTGGPDDAHDVQLQLDGRAVRFATGPLREHAPPNEGSRPQRGKSSFTQSEYLVYDERQLRLRYLVKVRI